MNDTHKKPNIEHDDSFFFNKEKELVDQIKTRRDLRVVRPVKDVQAIGPPVSMRTGGITKKAAS